MEYLTITPTDPKYPLRLTERLGDQQPSSLHYSGQLGNLERFTLAVISSDNSGGDALIHANQVLFTVREYAVNYIGGWHSAIESEVFRLSLFKSYNTTTLFSAKGLGRENFESFLASRFHPPFHEFPERKEYFKRVENGEMLMLSVTNPDQGRQLVKNIIERNWISCTLADVVFIPSGANGSKTYSIAKRVVDVGIPAFTTQSDECKELRNLGLPGLGRESVVSFLEENGAILAQESKKDEMRNDTYSTPLPRQMSVLGDSGSALSEPGEDTSEDST